MRGEEGEGHFLYSFLATLSRYEGTLMLVLHVSEHLDASAARSSVPVRRTPAAPPSPAQYNRPSYDTRAGARLVMQWAKGAVYRYPELPYPPPPAIREPGRAVLAQLGGEGGAMTRRLWISRRQCVLPNVAWLSGMNQRYQILAQRRRARSSRQRAGQSAGSRRWWRG